MTPRRALDRDVRGSAAAEMALVAPMLCLLLLGSAELGRYFYNEHVMLKAVRGGAVFAARQPIDKFNCSATPPTIDGSVVTATHDLVKTGALANGTNLLPQWPTTGGFTMTLACVTSAGGTTLGGIYTANAGNVPVLTVSASIPYNPILAGFGFGPNLTLKATEEAAVMGI